MNATVDKSNQLSRSEEDANGTSIAEQELRNRELNIREREVKNNYRLSILKVIITGAVATLIPAIINWQIQSQSIEIERLKNEQTYLKDFAKDALQEDLNKRYNFADYLATVAHSDESRKRWETYRKKLNSFSIAKPKIGTRSKSFGLKSRILRSLKT